MYLITCFALAAIGFVAFFTCYVRLVVLAFKERTTFGLLLLFVPYYFIYYGISRWKKTKLSTIIGAIAVFIFIGAILTPSILIRYQVKPVLTKFIQASADINIYEAYNYWIPDTNEDFVGQLVVNNEKIFTQFKKFTIRNIQTNYPWNGDLHSQLNGTIYYENSTIDFHATLTIIDGTWKIRSFTIGHKSLFPDN